MIPEIDEMFQNSEAVTASETEASYFKNFFGQLEGFVTVILVVTALVALCILFIAANTASMSVRERMSEIAPLVAGHRAHGGRGYDPAFDVFHDEELCAQDSAVVAIGDHPRCGHGRGAQRIHHSVFPVHGMCLRQEDAGRLLPQHVLAAGAQRQQVGRIRHSALKLLNPDAVSSRRNRT